MIKHQKCARENCTRLSFDPNKPYCSSMCHFIVSQIDGAEIAARKGGDPSIVHKWYAAAITLADTVDELTELKFAYQRSLRKKVDA